MFDIILFDSGHMIRFVLSVTYCLHEHFSVFINVSPKRRHERFVDISNTVNTVITGFRTLRYLVVLSSVNKELRSRYVINVTCLLFLLCCKLVCMYLKSAKELNKAQGELILGGTIAQYLATKLKCVAFRVECRFTLVQLYKHFR